MADAEQAQRGALVGRQVEHERVGAHRPDQRGAQQQPAEDDQQDARDVHREHNRAGVCREECGGHHHVDRQARGAGREGDEQGGEQPVPGVRQDAHRRDRWDVAAEPDHQRQERAPGQAEPGHEPVGHDSSTGHVARVLEQGQQGEHDGHEWHERQQHPHAGDEAVDDEPLDEASAQADRGERGRRHGGDRAGEERVQRALEGGCHGGREGEHGPHHGQEDDRSEDRGGRPAVDPVRPRLALPVRAGCGQGGRVGDPGEDRLGAGEVVVGIEAGGEVVDGRGRAGCAVHWAVRAAAAHGRGRQGQAGGAPGRQGPQ